ncbi:MAG: type II toxin-antitoxin system CcdA family antitoxin [Leptolyngbyaceae cyanobacterium SM2_3_12]|nr:type II toxin-antitoxin system CcdA family antitoxin [Leptolyngbyaceae cyanobacterium SM2_3_12]
MSDTASSAKDVQASSSEKVELSLQLDKELLDQISHLTSNPSKIIEVALRQWLRGDRRPEDDLVRHLPRNPAVPPKGEWND